MTNKGKRKKQSVSIAKRPAVPRKHLNDELILRVLDNRVERRILYAIVTVCLMALASGGMYLFLERPWEKPADDGDDKPAPPGTTGPETDEPGTNPPFVPVPDEPEEPGFWTEVVDYMKEYWYYFVFGLIGFIFLILFLSRVVKAFRDLYKRFGGGTAGALAVAGVGLIAAGVATGNPAMVAAGAGALVTAGAMYLTRLVLGKLTEFEEIHDFETIWSAEYEAVKDDALYEDQKQLMQQLDKDMKSNDPETAALAARRYFNFVQAVKARKNPSPLSRFFLSNGLTGYGDPVAALKADNPTTRFFFDPVKLIEKRRELYKAAANLEKDLPVAPGVPTGEINKARKELGREFQKVKYATRKARGRGQSVDDLTAAMEGLTLTEPVRA